MHPYTKIKEEQKSRAASLRTLKSERKNDEKGNKVRPLWETENQIDKEKWEYRHWHIARCELKGLKREQIEKPADDNLPNDSYIDKIKDQIREEVKEYENVRDCA